MPGLHRHRRPRSRAVGVARPGMRQRHPGRGPRSAGGQSPFGRCPVGLDGDPRGLRRPTASRYDRGMDLPVQPPVAPMLAKLTRELPRAEGMFYEPKWDGFRCIVFRDGDEVELGSRNEKPLTRYFPELLEPMRAQLPDPCVLDGEIVIASDGGLDFGALLQRVHPAES